MTAALGMLQTPEWGRPNPIDEFRYSQPQGLPTEELARYFASQSAPPQQLSKFFTPEQWASESPAVKEQRLNYLLNNPNQFAPGGRQHAPTPSLFSMSGRGAGGGAGIPGITSPGTPGVSGAVPPHVFSQPTPTPQVSPGETGGGTTSPAPLPTSATNESPGGDAAGVDTGAGGSAGQSFAEGGRAFGKQSELGFLNTPMGHIALTGLGMVPTVGALTGPISFARGVENALQFFTELAPNMARSMGLIPDTLQLTPESQKQLTAKIQQDLKDPQVNPRISGPEAEPEAGISGGTGGVGGVGPGGISTGDIAGDPGGTGAQGTPASSVSPTTGEVSFSSDEGQPGAAGPTSGDISASGDVGIGGAPSGAPAGEGAIGEGGTASGSDVGGQAADTGGGDAGGGGGGGGGCALATWALNSLKPKDEAQARQFFQQFYDGFMKLQGPSGKRLFSLYQVAAQRIMKAVQTRGMSETKKVQQEIYDRLVKPTGKSVEANEIPTAVKNLINVVKSLASRYDVALTPEMTKAAQTFSQGQQPRVFGKR